MMTSFEELYRRVEESSHETAFNREECLAIYELLKSDIQDHPINIVEIGIEFGRSTTVWAQYCAEARIATHFVAIDSWVGEYSQRAHDHVLEQIKKYGWKIDIWSMDSKRAAEQYDEKIDYLHVDGDHEYKAVLSDCENWLYKVKPGGFALFDDYGHDSLPGVYQGVHEYMDKHPEWQLIGRYGNKLGIFRKEFAK